MKTNKFVAALLALGLLAVQTACSKRDVNNQVPASEINQTESAASNATLKDSIHVEAENYTSMSGVQAETCREGGKDVGYIAKGDWMNYSVTPTVGGTYNIKVRVAGPGGSLQLQKADGTVLTTVTFPATAGGQVYTTATAQVNLTAGAQTLKIYAATAGWNFNWFELVSTLAPTTAAAIAPTTSSTAGVTLTSTFESTTDLNSWAKEICRSSALVISSDVARKGKTSARFEFTKSDVTNYNGYMRAEIHQNSPAEAENWFGFSNYLPADFVTDPLAEKIAQWHEIPDWDLGENWRSPPISLGIENGRYYLQVLWAAAAVNTNDTKDGEKKVDLGPVDLAKWNDWVFHIKFSYKSDGILEIWKNKVKVFSLYGPNSFNDKNYPYFKCGIYKWGWNGWASYSPESKRVLYYDEIRVGNKNANLTSVSPN
jgi:hypothetical protein